MITTSEIKREYIMGMRNYTKTDCDNIDAALFSGDQFMNPCAIKELEHFIARWQRELDRNKKAIQKEQGRKIVVAGGLLWEGKAGDNANILGVFEADDIARKNGFPYVEQLIRKYEGDATLWIDKDLKIFG